VISVGVAVWRTARPSRFLVTGMAFTEAIALLMASVMLETALLTSVDAAVFSSSVEDDVMEAVVESSVECQ